MVAELLGGAELVEITTSGDRVRAAGDKSRFVKEIEEALLAGDVDVAVHSAKDVPAVLPEGLEIAAVPARADARDVLVGAGSLHPGMRIGTASIRRRSQLLALEPELDVVELRGNVDTRLRKLAEGDYDAVVLAAAGLERLGRPEEATPIEGLVPAPGQGCLAIEIRSDDAATRETVRAIDDRMAHACLSAERDCVLALDATCDTPVGVFAVPSGDGLRIEAYAGAPDGSVWIRDAFEGGADAGRAIAERMLLAGAGDILAIDR